MNHLVCFRGTVQRRIGRPGNVSGIAAPPACGPSGKLSINSKNLTLWLMTIYLFTIENYTIYCCT